MCMYETGIIQRMAGRDEQKEERLSEEEPSHVRILFVIFDHDKPGSHTDMLSP